MAKATASAAKKKSPKKKSATKRSAKKTAKRRKAAKTLKPLSARPSTAIAKKTVPPGALELIPERPPLAPTADGAAALGMSRAAWTPKQQRDMVAAFDPEDYRILPDGMTYVPASRVRKRLTRIFGAGKVGIEVVGEPKVHGSDILVLVKLHVEGQLMAMSWGEGQYIASNRKMSYGDVLETAKSNGLMRCAKALGVGEECWDDMFQYSFRLHHGFYVKTAKGKQWRSEFQPPYETEKDICDDSPNKERYKKPSVVQRNAASKGGANPSSKDEAAARNVREHNRVVPGNDGDISTSALQQLIIAAKQHGRTDTELKGWLKLQFGIESKKKIQRSQFKLVQEWIRAPFDADPHQSIDTVVPGEVV